MCAWPRDYDPVQGKWYEDLEENEIFQVLSVDPDQELIEVEYENGDIEEIDLDTWHELDLELSRGDRKATDERWARDEEGNEEEEDEEDHEDDWDEDDDDWDDDEDEDLDDYNDQDDRRPDKPTICPALDSPRSPGKFSGPRPV